MPSTRWTPPYNDAQVAWSKAFGLDNFWLALGVNNSFGEDPPICYSCSFWAVTGA